MPTVRRTAPRSPAVKAAARPTKSRAAAKAPAKPRPRPRAQLEQPKPKEAVALDFAPARPAWPFPGSEPLHRDVTREVHHGVDSRPADVSSSHSTQRWDPRREVWDTVEQRRVREEPLGLGDPNTRSVAERWSAVRQAWVPADQPPDFF
ncbi:MAG: hypothetical protein JNK82_12525 [Myxococcaceae bacterium]|nr:hypothetical protein [Myxococcaceae bacterium]